MNLYQQTVEQIPDGIKVATAVSAPALSFLGVSVEDWTFILSAIVSFLFIVEKLPIFISRCRTLGKWIKDKYENSRSL